MRAYKHNWLSLFLSFFLSLNMLFSFFLLLCFSFNQSFCLFLLFFFFFSFLLFLSDFLTPHFVPLFHSLLSSLSLSCFTAMQYFFIFLLGFAFCSLGSSLAFFLCSLLPGFLIQVPNSSKHMIVLWIGYWSSAYTHPRAPSCSTND